MTDRRCGGEGKRGPCRRRPAEGERFCSFHEDQANVVSLRAGERSERPLRSVDELMLSAVSVALAALELDEEKDAAAVRLALRYADAIDRAADPDEALATFGPKLRLILQSLGATPKSRASLGSGGSGEQGRLATLRAARSG